MTWPALKEQTALYREDFFGGHRSEPSAASTRQTSLRHPTITIGGSTRNWIPASDRRAKSLQVQASQSLHQSHSIRLPNDNQALKHQRFDAQLEGSAPSDLCI
jgi:hypothetical protein